VTRAALVLGAAVWPGGVASPTLRRRAAHAAALWHAGAVAFVVPCGGVGRHGPSEAEVVRRLLLDAGVAPGAVRLEDRSRNTHENLLLARPVLLGLGAEAVIVTDRTHAPRALLIARGLGLRATASCPPPPGRRLVLRQGLREAGAWPVALWRLAAWRLRERLRG
jgi:uncharacterized SAM-binding protein YcdF (DUF218 family)